MADKASKFTPFSVTRNDQALLFKGEEVKRGDNKGWEYPTTEVSGANLFEFIEWAGKDNVAKKLDSWVRALGQGWWENAEETAKNSEGQINLDKAVELFTQMAQDFSARGESIPDLKGRIDELVDLITALDPTDPSYIAKVSEYSAEIKVKQNAIAMSRRKPRTSKDAAPATA